MLVTALSTTAVAQLNLTADQIQALLAALVLLLLSLLLAWRLRQVLINSRSSSAPPDIALRNGR